MRRDYPKTTGRGSGEGPPPVPRDARLSAVSDDTIVIDDLVGLAVLDGVAQPRVAWANPAFAALLAGGTGNVTGRRLDEIIDDRDVAAALAGVAAGGEQSVRAATSGGATIVVQLSSTGRDGQVLVAVRPVHTTARAALYDAVTGLASSALFREHLQLALNRRAREGDSLAVVAIGAAGFAAAWQEQAESAALLQTRMAERIEQVVRDADVLSTRRPGGFLLLVIDPTDAVAAAALVSERMLAAFETPLVLPDRLQRLDLHIGIGAALPTDEPDQVITRADAGLARAAGEGTNLYRVMLQ
jgi:GGDEF domain-containing protein